MRLRLLDTFCKAGGCTKGYQRAGFYVVGVDHEPQPHYCGDEFYQADALEFIRDHGHEFDVIHASPPCQAYSRATAWRGCRRDHPDLIDPVRDLLIASNKPWIIENVTDARSRLRSPLMLCGTMFGLKIQRHRYFEFGGYSKLLLTPPCRHSLEDYSHDHGKKQPESIYRDAMDCGWMTVHEARQAIPPAYTEFIGRQLMQAIKQAQEKPCG